MIPYSVKRSVKQIISGAAGLVRSQGPRTVILCYHSINTAESYLAVSPDSFRRQLQWLEENGFSFHTISQLANELAPTGRPRVALTFDDGFADNLTIAAPILKAFGATGTVFVTTGLVQGDDKIVTPMQKMTEYSQPFLTPTQVRELHEAGIEIGGHTHTHSNLALLDDRQLDRELVDPKNWLEQTIGGAVTSFAYPFGKRHMNYTAHTMARVEQAGYHCAAAVAFRGIKPSDAGRRFELPRLFVTPDDSLEMFAQKVLGDWDWLATWQHAVPRWAKAILSPRDKYPYVIADTVTQSR
jgi:peptidoglycan/xylan/chitin deacetylase (PgdA/CDA1 family)